MSNFPKAHLATQAKILLDEEIERSKCGLETVGVSAQLHECRNQLDDMIDQLQKENLPPKNQRLRGMGHMIADSWPIDSKLGEALLLAEQAYRAI